MVVIGERGLGNPLLTSSSSQPFENKLTMLLLDEFQTWVRRPSPTQAVPVENWAFNFIQILRRSPRSALTCWCCGISVQRRQRRLPTGASRQPGRHRLSRQAETRAHPAGPAPDAAAPPLRQPPADCSGTIESLVAQHVAESFRLCWTCCPPSRNASAGVHRIVAVRAAPAAPARRTGADRHRRAGNARHDPHPRQPLQEWRGRAGAHRR